MFYQYTSTSNYNIKISKLCKMSTEKLINTDRRVIKHATESKYPSFQIDQYINI